MANLRVYAALSNDVNQGWVWIGLKSQLPHRSIVRMVARNSGKSAFCEVLSIDSNFLRAYNKPPRISIKIPEESLVAPEWYREKLGIKTRSYAEIDVEPANHALGMFRACMDHPQVVVRLAAVLAVLSVLLGVVGVVFGLISLM